MDCGILDWDKDLDPQFEAAWRAGQGTHAVKWFVWF